MSGLDLPDEDALAIFNMIMAVFSEVEDLHQKTATWILNTASMIASSALEVRAVIPQRLTLACHQNNTWDNNSIHGVFMSFTMTNNHTGTTFSRPLARKEYDHV